MATPKQVLDYLEALVADADTLQPRALGHWWEGFGEVTQKEFPYCETMPVCHVNLREAIDGFNGSGFPFVDRTLRVAIYVTFKTDDLEDKDPQLWAVLEALRAVLAADRTLGALLNLPVTRFDIREVPSPIGTVFVGCRRIEFEALIRETLV